jgi:hypothetical protein
MATQRGLGVDLEDRRETNDKKNKIFVHIDGRGQD